jgi:endoglucanase
VKTDFTKLYVDIGATSREDARKYVDIGDVACFDGAYREFANSIVSVKALDDRIGCHILLETLKALKQTTDHVVFAFTVQEEVGCRGSRVAAERVQPDIGVSVDVTPAHDRPGDLEGSNALGEGVAIKISDTSVICDEDLVGEFIGLCREKDIPFQKEVLYVGGTDASSMNLSNQGVRAAGISVVTRYTHGPNAMVHMGDVAAAIALLTAWLGK